ncbi:MAG: two-component system sensor histidine kinase [Crocinitomicaceae bacterium]|nr:two-component system sensor histidine kinase [Crocinitomicaceae bacterium]
MKKAAICLIFILSVFTLRAQDIDSLKRRLKDNIDDTTRLVVLSKISIAADDGEWQQYNRKQKILAAKLRSESSPKSPLYRVYSKHYANAIHNEGIDLLDHSELRKALQLQQEALAIYEEIGDKKSMTHPLSEISKIYVLSGAFEQAISTFYQTLRIYESLKDYVGIGDCYLGLGEIHATNLDYEKAIKNYKLAIQYYQMGDTKDGVSIVCCCISACFSALQEYDKAARYLAMAEKNNLEGKPYEKALIFLHWGMLKQKLNKTDEAVRFYRDALQLFEEQEELSLLCSTKYHLGQVLMEQKDYRSALKYGLEALELSTEIEFPVEIENSTWLIYETYKKMGQYEKSLLYLEKYNDILAKKNTSEIKNIIFQEQLNYEFEKKQLLDKARNEKRISRLKLDAERKNFRKNVWITITLFISCIAVLLIFFGYRNARQKSIIAGQKNNILKQKLLVSQMNPHFIFNSLNAIQNCIFKQDGLKAGTYLAQFAELMRMILEFSRKDFIPLESEVNMLHNYFQLQQFRFDGKFEYNIEIDPALIPSKTGIPPMLAQPFIENSIEHGIFFKEEPGFIQVKISRQGEFVRYEITDNGVGIEGGKKFKRNTSGSHNSLATIITQERIDALFLNKKGASQIKITDLCTEDQTLSGVRVSFEIPYQEL